MSSQVRQPSAKELEKRRIVGINSETVTDVTSTDFPGHYPGEDHAWSIEKFRKAFSVHFYQNAPYEAAFSLVGIDASVANAFRRILMAEVPTFAIEYVFVSNNTSVIQDEVLAHRLGLIPLTGDVEGFRQMGWCPKPETTADGEPGNPNSTDTNTLLFKLEAKCTRKPVAPADKDEDDPLKLYDNAHIYARDLTWHPVGRQGEMFAGPGGTPRAAYPDILLVKMRPGQVIDLEMHAIKGIGADHAKFSPVATASYRLLPTITITRPIVGSDALKFQKCFPQGVIGLEKVTRDDAAQHAECKDHVGEQKAVVEDAFNDTVSRECLRHDEFKDKVKLGRVRDHFIFSIESTGQYSSDALFLESIKVLRAKCSVLRRDLTYVTRH